MFRPKWNQQSEKQRLLSALDSKIQKVRSILRCGEEIVRKSQSSSSGESNGRVFITALPLFLSAKLETLVKARCNLQRSEGCTKCVKEAQVIVSKPEMSFFGLDSTLKLMQEKTVVDPMAEFERAIKKSDLNTVMKEFIECFNKTKEESTDLEAERNIRNEALAKIEELIKASREEEKSDIDANLAILKAEAQEIIQHKNQVVDNLNMILQKRGDLELAAYEDRISNELSTQVTADLTQMDVLFEQLNRARHAKCTNCLADKMEEMRQPFQEFQDNVDFAREVVEALEDSVDPTRHMNKADITQEMIDAQKATCPICLKDLQLGYESALSCPGCKQVYGKDCINSWLADNNTCPSCRHKVRSHVTISDHSGRIYIN